MSISVIGCSASTAPSLSQSPAYYNFLQPSFSDYLDASKRWLTRHRRYITDDHDKELAMNMPFEVSASQAKKGILLVHGLGDSPYSFSDIAPILAADGFDVQVLLLPGHGSDPKHMELPHYRDWQRIVDHYANLLKQQYDEVWLGGFSTGGNLVTTHALEQGNVDGLLLFSPGFQSDAPVLEKLIPLVSWFWDGFDREEVNLARYSSLTLNGAEQYAESAQAVRDALASNTVSIPTLMVLSADDSVVDVKRVMSLYTSRFTHPSNQLIWYGTSPEGELPESFHGYNMRLPAEHIATASHMSSLFSPSNPYYGKDGEFRFCHNGSDDEQMAQCIAGEPVWYSAWGIKEEGKIFARLTWNPYFKQMSDSMMRVIHGEE